MSELYFQECLCNGRNAYNNIAKLHEDILNTKDETIKLYLSTEQRMGNTFVFLCGCLPFVAKALGKKISVFCNGKVYNRLESLDIFGDKTAINDSRFVKINNPNDITELTNIITKEAPVQLAPSLSSTMSSMLAEMYNNAYEHSNAEDIMCGRFFRENKKRYTITCYDTGIGIPAKISQYFQTLNLVELNQFLCSLKDIDYINWALIRGNSTRNTNNVKGCGLDLLKEFAEKNNGTIRICSGKGLYEYSKGTCQPRTLQHSFHGTLFEMDIISDKNYEYYIKE